jgi:hypothetical protein
MKHQIMFISLFVLLVPIVSASYTLCVRTQGGDICMNSTLLTGTKINYSDILNSPASFSWTYSNIFDQNLNTTNDVAFHNITLDGNPVCTSTNGYCAVGDSGNNYTNAIRFTNDSTNVTLNLSRYGMTDLYASISGFVGPTGPSGSNGADGADGADGINGTVPNSSVQCAGTDKLYNVSVNTSGVYGVCASDENTNYDANITALQEDNTTQASLINLRLLQTDQRYNETALIDSNSTTFSNLISGLVSSNTTLTSETAKKINLTGYQAFSASFNTTGNITTNNYFFGQPLLGMMGSGIISSTETNQISEVNITCSGLTCSYNTFEVRLVSGTSDQFAKYCKIPAGSVTLTNDAHNVIYIDNACAVQKTTISTWFNSLLKDGGQWDFGNAVCYHDNCEVVNGIGLEQRRMMKQRIINFNKNHLSVTSGFTKSVQGFPNFTIDSGNYIYLMDVVPFSTQAVAENDSIEVIIPNGTGWIHSPGRRLNYTTCQNGTDAISPCANTNRWRRIFLFAIGYNESSSDTSELHQLLPSNTITYTSEALCLDTVTTPITYALPSYYNYAAVPLYAYCAKPTDSAWSSTGWIDLRTVKVGSGTSTSSATFVPYTGASGNVDLGGNNLTATSFYGYINSSYVQLPYWVNGSGTSGKIAKFTDTRTIGNSIMTEYTNETIGILGALSVRNDTVVGGDLLIGGSVLNVLGQNVTGNIIPAAGSSFTLGNPTRTWMNIYVVNVNATTLTGNLNASYIQNSPWLLTSDQRYNETSKIDQNSSAFSLNDTALWAAINQNSTAFSLNDTALWAAIPDEFVYSDYFDQELNKSSNVIFNNLNVTGDGIESTSFQSYGSVGEDDLSIWMDYYGINLYRDGTDNYISIGPTNTVINVTDEFNVASGSTRFHAPTTTFNGIAPTIMTQDQASGNVWVFNWSASELTINCTRYMTIPTQTYCIEGYGGINATLTSCTFTGLSPKNASGNQGGFASCT